MPMHTETEMHNADIQMARKMVRLSYSRNVNFLGRHGALDLERRKSSMEKGLIPSDRLTG